MYGLSRHPRFELLSEFSDGDLAGVTAERVAQHLEACGRCRNEVARIRETDEALRGVPIPGVPEGVFDRIVERREANVRTLLPQAPVAAPPPPERRSVAAAALLITGAALAAFVVMNGEASAGASSLDLEVLDAEAAILQATYLPDARLANADAVHVRAWVWPLDRRRASYALDLGTLPPEGGGFAGPVRLPSDAGFAILAFEDQTGSTIDVQWGEFWMPTGEDGQPTPAALATEIRALEDLGSRGLMMTAETRRTARRATEFYPDDVRLWEARALYELAIDATVSDDHNERLDGFVEAALAGTKSPEEIATLYGYALLLGRVEAATAMLDLLEGVAPDHHILVQGRLLDALSGNAERGRVVEVVEQAYQANLEDGLAEGIGFTMSLDDPEEMLVWAGRYAALGPTLADEAAMKLAANAELRAKGIERLRERIDYYADPAAADRQIHVTAQEYERELRHRRAELFTRLGDALYTTGQDEAGLDAYRSSIDEDWDPDVAEAIVADAESRGVSDVAYVSRLRRLLQVDPLHTAAATWRPLTVVAREAAVADLFDAVGGDQVRTMPTPELGFRSRVGSSVDLDDGGTSLIALWQVPPGLDSEEARALAEATAELAQAGVRTLVAVPEAWLEEVVEIADRAEARAVVDEDGTVTEALDLGWYLRRYIVVHDGKYSVHDDLDEATRLALLRLEKR